MSTPSLAVRTATEVLERLKANEARLAALQTDRELRSLRLDIAYIENLLAEHAALIAALPADSRPLFGPHECRRCDSGGRRWVTASDGSEIETLCDECNGTAHCLREVCTRCRDDEADLSKNGTTAAST